MSNGAKRLLSNVRDSRSLEVPGRGRRSTQPKSYDKRVALVLQGGGALGSYQAGAYEALADSRYAPDWICGISIGAFNAAIIAGNAREERVTRLKQFWEAITTPSPTWTARGRRVDEIHRRLAALAATLLGQSGFFRPWNPWLALQGDKVVSLYDTSALRSTLERYVDFDRINAKETRLSVGAVDVKTGNFTYFDNAETAINPEHVMASGALPPAFPAIKIDNDYYWDGGLVSNTPLQYLISYYPRHSRLIFQVDLFPSRGPLPTTLEQVSEREKEIRYSSRTRMGTDSAHTMHDIRHNLDLLLAKLPDALKTLPEAQFLRNVSCITTMDIAQLIYRPEQPQGSYKDYEFSRSTMQARWAAGFSDTRQTLESSPWLEPMPREVGVRTFDVVWDLRAADAARLP